MRIISGSLGGRKFYPPQNLPARPTTDVAKTGLFNILVNNFDLDEISFLDLFAGTGNISYEMASRGCGKIVSVDKDERCVQFIKKMLKEWKIASADVRKNDVFRFLDFNIEPFDLIFAGPPYPLETIDELPDKILNNKHLRQGGWLILETSPKHSYKNNPHFFRVTNYGQTTFHFFKYS